MTVLIIIVIIFFLIRSSKQNKSKNSNSNKALVRNVSYASATKSEIISLIEQGADLEARAFGSGATPLMRAAYVGRNDLVQILIDAGANINARDNTGSTPLMIAAMQNNVETFKLLIDAGADLLIKDNRGQTVEDYANDKEILFCINGKENNSSTMDDIDEYISLFIEMSVPALTFARIHTTNLKIFDSIPNSSLDKASAFFAMFLTIMQIRSEIKIAKFIKFISNIHNGIDEDYMCFMRLMKKTKNAETAYMEIIVNILFKNGSDFDRNDIMDFTSEFMLNISSFMGNILEEKGYTL